MKKLLLFVFVSIMSLFTVTAVYSSDHELKSPVELHFYDIQLGNSFKLDSGNADLISYSIGMIQSANYEIKTLVIKAEIKRTKITNSPLTEYAYFKTDHNLQA